MEASLKLRNLRKEAGLTQNELAVALGIPKRTIENYEGGKRLPPDWVMNALFFEINQYIHEDPTPYDRKTGVYSLMRLRLKINEALEKIDGVESVTLFGSYAKGTADRFSDIDIMIETKRKGFALFAIFDAIEDCTGKKVDGYSWSELSDQGSIRQEIEITGIKIYERKQNQIPKGHRADEKGLRGDSQLLFQRPKVNESNDH